MNIARVLKSHKYSALAWDGVSQVGRRTASLYRLSAPPLSVDAFRDRALRGGRGGSPLRFTNGKADAELVAGMYAEVMEFALKNKETIYFAESSWTDADVAMFIPSLRLTPALRYLKLRSNQIGDGGIIELCRAISDGAVPALKILWLGDNPFGRAGLAAIAAAASTGLAPQLPTGARVKRAGGWLSRSRTRAEASALLKGGRLQNLRWLDLDGCSFGGDETALDAFFTGLQPGALRSLEMLSLRGTPSGARICAAEDDAPEGKWGVECIDRARTIGALTALEKIRGEPLPLFRRAQSSAENVLHAPLG